MKSKVQNSFTNICEDEFNSIRESIAILFIAHTDDEHELLLDNIGPLFKEGPFSRLPLKYVDANSSQIYYLGSFGTQKIVYTKTSHMGSTKPFGSINTMNHAITTWRPLLVVMLGICAGLKNQSIGDVVISRELISYEEGKQKKYNFIPRCYHYYPGEIYKAFDNLPVKQKGNDSTDFIIHKGTYLCGEKLVNSLCFRNAMLRLFPESQALEMEGHGVGSACVSNRLYNWIIIKGISDHAYKKNNSNGDVSKRRAMSNAIKTALLVFDTPENFVEINRLISLRKPRIRNIFISTSHLDKSEMPKCQDCVPIEQAYQFCRELAYEIAQNQMIIFTGVGKTTGNAIICGVDDYIIGNNIDKKSDFAYTDFYDSFVFSRPIDSDNIGGISVDKYKIRHREMIIKNTYAAVFLFGCKIVNGQVVNADGVNEEFEVAKASKKFIVPVGATGFKSKEIWDYVSNNIDKFYPIVKNSDTSESDYRAKEALRKELFNKLNCTIDFEKESERKKLVAYIMDFLSQQWR